MTTAQKTENISNTLDRLAAGRVFVTVRTSSAEDALWVSRLLVDAGLTMLEIAYTTPDASSVIESLATEYPDLLLGAGTVLDQKTAAEALAAGAHFLMSPVLDEQLIQFANDHDVLMLPGTLTPNEVYRAVQAGAHAVKLFPAGPSGGVDYVKAIKGPLKDVKIIPTGGVPYKCVPDYLEIGCPAVCASLVSKEEIAERNEEAIRKHVGKCLKKIARWSGEDHDYKKLSGEDKDSDCDDHDDDDDDHEHKKEKSEKKHHNKKHKHDKHHAEDKDDSKENHDS